jgi:hypothetical protein
VKLWAGFIWLRIKSRGWAVVNMLMGNLARDVTLVSCSHYFFNPEDGDDMFLRNVG